MQHHSGPEFAAFCHKPLSSSPVNQLEDNQQVPRKRIIFFHKAAPIGEEWRFSN